MFKQIILFSIIAIGTSLQAIEIINNTSEVINFERGDYINFDKDTELIPFHVRIYGTWKKNNISSFCAYIGGGERYFAENTSCYVVSGLTDQTKIFFSEVGNVIEVKIENGGKVQHITF